MNWISLKAVYLAVLWVTEEKLNIFSESRVGEWDTSIGEGKQLPIKRAELAKSLGISFFDNSIYGSEFDDVMSLGNLVDGIVDLVEENTVQEPQDAYILTHQTLLGLFASGAVSARNGYTFAMTPKEIIDNSGAHSKQEASDISVWKEKPLPNYELSALHMGANQDFWFLKRRMTIDENSHDVIPTGCEYWMTNIQVNKTEFENWLRPHLPANYLLPRTAILKPQNGKFLIQFGNDHQEYKARKGLKLIRLIIKNARVSNENAKAYQVERLSYAIEQDGEDEVDLEGLINSKDDDSNAENINKQKKLLKGLITKYFEKLDEYHSTCEPDEIDELLESISNARGHATSLANKIDSFEQSNQFKTLVKNVLTNKSPSNTEMEAISRMFEEDSSDDKNLRKLTETYKKTIQNELERLKATCPEFVKHIGSVTTESNSGIIVKGNGFIYYPAGKIDWKLD